MGVPAPSECPGLVGPRAAPGLAPCCAGSPWGLSPGVGSVRGQVAGGPAHLPRGHRPPTLVPQRCSLPRGEVALLHKHRRAWAAPGGTPTPRCLAPVVGAGFVVPAPMGRMGLVGPGPFGCAHLPRRPSPPGTGVAGLLHRCSPASRWLSGLCLPWWAARGGPRVSLFAHLGCLSGSGSGSVSGFFFLVLLLRLVAAWRRGWRGPAPPSRYALPVSLRGRAGASRDREGHNPAGTFLVPCRSMSRLACYFAACRGEPNGVVVPRCARGFALPLLLCLVWCTAPCPGRGCPSRRGGCRARGGAPCSTPGGGTASVPPCARGGFGGGPGGAISGPGWVRHTRHAGLARGFCWVLASGWGGCAGCPCRGGGCFPSSKRRRHHFGLLLGC